MSQRPHWTSRRNPPSMRSTSSPSRRPRRELTRPLLSLWWLDATWTTRGDDLATAYPSGQPGCGCPRPIDDLHLAQHRGPAHRTRREAVLIAITGGTGLTMPDRPFEDERTELITAKPSLSIVGRSAWSPDDGQGTHLGCVTRSEDREPVITHGG